MKLSVIEVPHEEAEEVSVRCHDENAKWVNDIRAVTAGSMFFRSGKSMVLNADKIDCVKPSLSGRFEAMLTNGERVIISRQYVSSLKKLLGL